MRKIVPGILAALALPCTAHARESYKRIVSDEFVRGHLSTQGIFASSGHGVRTGVTGSLLTFPSALAGGDIRQTSASATAHYRWGWHTTKLGDIQPFFRATAGGAYYEGNARDEAGLFNDSVEGEVASLSAGYGLRWRPWPSTTVSISMNYGYLYTSNDYAYARGTTGIGDGSTRNWFAHVASSATELGVRQTFPLVSDTYGKAASGKSIPRLTLSSNITSLSMFGAYGETRHQQRYVSSVILTNSLELDLPLATDSGDHLRATLFIERSDILFGGRRSLTRDKCFYQAGLRIGKWHQNDDTADWTDGIHLAASAIWGKGLNGWQVGIGLQF